VLIPPTVFFTGKIMRFLTQGLAAILLALLLAGCGFQMRGDWQLPAAMNQTAISGKYSQALFDELKRNFKSASASLTKGPGSASQTQLRIFDDRMDRRVLSVGATGKVLEYELFYIVDFDVVGEKGRPIVKRQKLVLTRDYLFEEDNVIGSGRQEDLLRGNLRQDMVALMMRRIQAQAK